MVPTAEANRAWNLETFLDSLILELDKAQDTLAVKGLNRRLTYTVKDLALEMKIFPQFDGDMVRFKTAQPGEEGASTVKFQLGSILDTQIREVSSEPPTRDTTSLESVDIPETERRQLEKLGIRSVEELERTVQGRKIDLDRVTRKRVTYDNLAGAINKLKRGASAPRVDRVSLSKSAGRDVLTLHGENLAVGASADGFPAALLDDTAAEVLSSSERELRVAVDRDALRRGRGQLRVALDPHAMITMKLDDGGKGR
ncbi:MAG: hypothetical protein KDK70_16915 [Myxococcales bacterium]|nr:hypothetical protein [Myxococcales bacterium]